MNQTKVGEHTYINVPLPEGATTVLFREFKSGYYVDYIKNKSNYATFLDLPDGEWELVGICHEIAESEELAKGVVRNPILVCGEWCYETFDKPYRCYYEESATQSFATLMTANNWKPNDLIARKIE